MCLKQFFFFYNTKLCAQTTLVEKEIIINKLYLNAVRNNNIVLMP